jgi:hypothetical protein
MYSSNWFDYWLSHFELKRLFLCINTHFKPSLWLRKFLRIYSQLDTVGNIPPFLHTQNVIESLLDPNWLYYFSLIFSNIELQAIDFYLKLKGLKVQCNKPALPFFTFIFSCSRKWLIKKSNHICYNCPDVIDSMLTCKHECQRLSTTNTYYKQPSISPTTICAWFLEVKRGKDNCPRILGSYSLLFSDFSVPHLVLTWAIFTVVLCKRLGTLDTKINQTCFLSS